MFDQAINLFERFVVSQEQIANALNAQVHLNKGAGPAPAASQMKDPDPDPAESQPAGNKERREFLKAKLTEMGVEFKDRAATETLEKQFQEELARLEKAANEEAKAETAAPAPAASEYNLEDVRAKLKEFAAKSGTDKARAILQEFGAANLTALDSKHYAAFVAKIS